MFNSPSTTNGPDGKVNTLLLTLSTSPPTTTTLTGKKRSASLVKRNVTAVLVSAESTFVKTGTFKVESRERCEVSLKA